MNITIDDVAKVASVSKATVSAVLNDRPGISQQTRLHVLEIVKKLNYRPSQVARSLSSQTTKSIGLVIKEIDNPFFAKVMKGVFDTCSKHDYTVLLGSSELSPTQEVRSMETLIGQRVDGIIISPLQGFEVDFNYLVSIINDQYPLVLLGHVANITTNVVDTNNVQAAYEATSYLISLGHTNIAYFAGPSYSAHSQDRLEGYQSALIDNHIAVEKNFIISAGSYINDGYQAGRSLFLESVSHPTAVFCYNDLVAIGLINALLENGKNVPHDVSVIGFDDIMFCESVKIPLTTVHVPAYEIGEAAASVLIEQIKNRNELLNKKVILNTQLIKRDSCARRL